MAWGLDIDQEGEVGEGVLFQHKYSLSRYWDSHDKD